jgi:hypothetical protein
MSILTEHVEIGRRFNQEWNGLTTISWPNVTFNPPDQLPDSKWVRFNILDDPPPGAPYSLQKSIGSPGNNIVRYTGTIVVQCFTGLGKGNLPGLALADKVEQIFNGFIGTNFKCLIGATKDIGVDKNGWYQVNVSIPFYRDELK